MHHTCALRDPCWAYGAGATASVWDYCQLASVQMCAHVKFCLPVCRRPRPRQQKRAVVSRTDWERRADDYGCDLEEVSPVFLLPFMSSALLQGPNGITGL